jgi:hypothetical protein
METRSELCRIALHNCGYETASIAQDAETCLQIKPTATSEWHNEQISVVAANESPALSLLSQGAKTQGSLFI